MSDTMRARIERSLSESLDPVHVQLNDESHKHAAGAGAETHWNLVVVSAAFASQRLVQRHRAVYEALGSELREGIHALTMKTLSPDEWDGGSIANVAPPCGGGSKSG